jgi:thioredoxin-related protein
MVRFLSLIIHINLYRPLSSKNEQARGFVDACVMNFELVSSLIIKYCKCSYFDPARDAKKDIQDAINQAQKTHRRILLDVGGDRCIWCLRLDSLFLQNKDLAEYLNKHYVVVKVNVSTENKNEEFLSNYPKVAGYPHLFVLDRNGKLLHSQDTEKLEYPKNYPVKGHNKKKVFKFLKKWAR